MPQLDQNSHVSLTPLGKKQVESLKGEGLRFAILSQLYESGGMTIGELRVALRALDLNKLVGAIKVLGRDGYIQRTGSVETLPPQTPALP